MKQESKRLSSIIIAALIIAAALVVYFEFIVPAYASIEDLKGQTESEAAAYANQSVLANDVNSLYTTYESDASSSQTVAFALPVGPDVSGALAQVYGIAANTGVTVTATGISTQAVQAVAPSLRRRRRIDHQAHGNGLLPDLRIGQLRIHQEFSHGARDEHPDIRCELDIAFVRCDPGHKDPGGEPGHV